MGQLLLPLISCCLLLAARGAYEVFAEADDEVSHMQVKTAGATRASAQPAPHVVNVACVGDSITNGYHAVNSFLSYPGQLQQLLGPSLGPQVKYNVWNFGHNGAMATRIPKNASVYETLAKDGKTPYWDTKEFEASKAVWGRGPDIVLIMLGTNDANRFSWPEYGDEYAASYVELINVYKGLPSKPEVHIAVPPPMYGQGAYNLLQDVINTDLPRIVPRVSDSAGMKEPISIHNLFRRHCPVITNDTTDCDWISGAGFGTPPSPPFDDGVHPNSNGYYAIASTMFPKVFLAGL